MNDEAYMIYYDIHSTTVHLYTELTLKYRLLSSRCAETEITLLSGNKMVSIEFTTVKLATIRLVTFNWTTTGSWHLNTTKDAF